MKSESAISTEVALAIGSIPGVRIFRNTVGEGWHGDVVAHGPKVVRLEPGDIVLRNPRRVRFGLSPDSGDFIGWVFGRFFSVEVKKPGGVIRKGQHCWVDAVNAAGGVAGIVYSADDARALVDRATTIK